MARAFSLTGCFSYFVAVFGIFCCEAQLPSEDYIVRKDPSIDFELLTEELIEKLFLEQAQIDPRFPKWVITFNEIPGKLPYALQEKRVVQKDSDQFIELGAAPPSDILLAKIMKNPVRLVLSSQGYLLGEEVTFRLTGKDKEVFKEIVISPRPLVLRRDSGQILATAKLCDLPYVNTHYIIDIKGIGEKERFKFIATSGDEMIRTAMEGPTYIYHTPGVLDLEGGASKIELHLEDGSIHKLEFPWGSELHHYNMGEK